MLPLIGAGLGAGLSLIGEIGRKDAEDRAARRRRKALEKAKIDSREEASIDANINRNFNTQSMSSQNASALGLSSVLNSDTLKGLNSSVLLGQRASALAESKMNIMKQNNELDAEIANVPSSEPVSAANVLTGGFMGYQIGESLDKLNPTDITTETEDTKYGDYTTLPWDRKKKSSAKSLGLFNF